MNWNRPGLRASIIAAAILAWAAAAYFTWNDPSETETAQAIADDLKAAALQECEHMYGRRECDRGSKAAPRTQGNE